MSALVHSLGETMTHLEVLHARFFTSLHHDDNHTLNGRVPLVGVQIAPIIAESGAFNPINNASDIHVMQ